MDPFILSRNAFNTYCSEYVNTNSSSTINNQSTINKNLSEKLNHNNLHYEKAIHKLNQRYEYFLQTLNGLQTSFKQTIHSHNINSISNSERDISTVSSSISKKKNKKLNKQRMPKIYVTVSCTEHLTQQQPNIKWN